MNLTSIGDLAQSLMVRNQSAHMKRSITTLTQELTTGRTSDIAARVGGDYGYLSDIRSSLTRLDGFDIAASEAGTKAASVQATLDRLHWIAGDLSNVLISVPAAETPAARKHASVQAVQYLGAAVSALNTNVAGRSLFSGTDTDRAPLATPDVILDQLRAQISGLTTADDVILAAQAWFSDPAGFETQVYQGSAVSLAPMQIGPDDSVDLSLRADDAVFRDALMNIALAALAAEPSTTFAPDVQEEIQRKVGNAMLNDQDDLTSVRADVGFLQSRIEDTIARHGASRTSYDMALSTLIGADPFEVATRLEETQFQLESLYAVTVRSSQLSLLNFLS